MALGKMPIRAFAGDVPHLINYLLSFEISVASFADLTELYASNAPFAGVLAELNAPTIAIYFAAWPCSPMVPPHPLSPALSGFVLSTRASC